MTAKEGAPSAKVSPEAVNLEELWAAIESAGPLVASAGFDPMLVDDVVWAEREMSQYDRRRAFVATYAWAVPTRGAIERVAALAGERTVIEVGAGNGLWAFLLSRAGAKVVATDGVAARDGTWYQVEAMEAEAAVRAHPECQALMLCWPPFKDPCAIRALQTFAGDLVVYIGDPNFTADAQFHALLAKEWRLVEEIPLPSWPGTSDGVRVYARAA